MINNIINIAEYKHETVSGEGSVSWDKGIKCYIPSVKVKGKAEQEMYSGVNLLLCKGGNLTQGETFSYAGRNFIVDNNGVVTVTADATVNQANVYYNNNNPVYLEAGKTYTFVGANFQIRNGTTNVKTLYPVKTPATYTASEGDYMAYAWYYFAAGESGAGTYYPMVVKGAYTSATLPPHEPFVGGIPAPNPQYPLYPIFAAPRLNALGVNLWNNKNFSATVSTEGIDITEVSDSYITITSKDNYNRNGYKYSGKILKEICPTLQAGKTYYLWGETQSSVKQIYLVGSGRSFPFGASRTLSEADLSSYIVFYGFSASGGQGTGKCRISNIMITESEIQPKYTPYFDGGTAQCPELYAMPDGEFADVYDTQTGNITRKILKALLTGNETITASTAFGNGVRIANIFDGASADGYIGLCSHAVVGESMHFTPLTGSVFWHNILGELNMTLEEFKVWLAEQYNSGNPVTIWYPISTPEKTTVDVPEKLKMPKGSAQIIQTDSGLVTEIEAKILKHS